MEKKKKKKQSWISYLWTWHILHKQQWINNNDEILIPDTLFILFSNEIQIGKLREVRWDLRAQKIHDRISIASFFSPFAFVAVVYSVVFIPLTVIIIILVTISLTRLSCQISS